MRTLKNYFCSYTQSCLIFLYFCIPKIDLINIPFFLTGIRIQDLLVLILLILNFQAIKAFSLRANKLYFVFFGSIFIFNIFIGNALVAAIIFSRIFEYFIIGFSFYITNKVKILLYSILSLNIFIGLLQKIQLIPVVDPMRGIYQSQTMNGSFGTPAEFSYFILVSLFLLTTYHRQIYPKFLFPIALENSISASFFSALFLFDYKKYLKLSLLPIYFYAFLFISTSGSHSITFIKNTYFSSINQMEYQEDYKNNNSTPRKLLGQYHSKDHIDEPISLNYRTGKWKDSIQRYSSSRPVGWMLGNGAGSSGNMDGGIVKFFCEYGLVGIILFFLFTRVMRFRAFGLVFFLNLAFDAYVSSIIAPLIILIFLYETQKKS
jgi:hypothetical protein